MLSVAKQHVAFSVCLWWENIWQTWARSLCFLSPTSFYFTKDYYCALEKKQDVAASFAAAECTWV